MFSVCKVGGVRRDIGGAVLKEMKRVLKDLSEKFLPMLNVFMDDDTVHSRLKGVGKLTMEEALELGCIGPMARASGILTDIRAAEKDSVYGQLHFQPVIETDGDCYARARVRLREVLRSVENIEGRAAEKRMLCPCGTAERRSALLCKRKRNQIPGTVPSEDTDKCQSACTRKDASGL